MEMSFKGIRSRFHSPRGDSPDTSSPSRANSFFHQLAALLVHDDSSANKQDSDQVNGLHLGDELLSLMTGTEGHVDAKQDEDAAAAFNGEALADSALIPEHHHHSFVNRPSVVGGRSDWFELSGSDADREASLTDGDTARRATSNICHLGVPTANSSGRDRPSRYRFGRRGSKRLERSKSLDRSVDQAPSPSPSIGEAAQCITTSRSSSSSRLPHRRIAAWARELMDDLQSIEEAHSGHRPRQNGEDPGEPLAVKRLKNNVMRFGRVTGPFSSLSDSIQSLRQWRSPTASLLFILVAAYAIWHGLFLALLVAFGLLRLTQNYLSSRGWLRHLGCSSGGDGSDESAEESSSSSSVADRLAVILQVARKVQNQLGAVCDAAEKIKNLLMWRHEASRRLYLMMWIALLLTLFFPASRIFTWLGFYLLVKLFVIDYVFFRFPRLRAKYDTSALMWDELPTDADLDAREMFEQGLCNAAAANTNNEPARTFWESFNLPPTENPLPGWSSGLRCTLVNRDKSLTSSIKSGRLFLTDNYLCFERSKTNPGKNVVIPLDRIVRLEKGNQYSWIPGGGMIIEVFIQGLDRAYTFGAIMNRDDVFISIRDAAEKLGCVWREDKSASSPAVS